MGRSQPVESAGHSMWSGDSVRPVPLESVDQVQDSGQDELPIVEIMGQARIEGFLQLTFPPGYLSYQI